MSEEEKKIQKGFNDGYLMQQFSPGLANTLKRGISKNEENPYIESFLAGCNQYEAEQTRQRGPSKSKELSKREQERAMYREQERLKNKEREDRDLGR